MVRPGRVRISGGLPRGAVADDPHTHTQSDDSLGCLHFSTTLILLAKKLFFKNFFASYGARMLQRVENNLVNACGSLHCTLYHASIPNLI